MTALVDTSVLIDVLRGDRAAVDLLTAIAGAGPIYASEITRTEVLVGVRDGEGEATDRLLAGLDWQAVDEEVSTAAGVLGRTWIRSHRGIDTADLIIAATAQTLGLQLLTRNVKHFPMFPGLTAPY